MIHDIMVLAMAAPGGNGPADGAQNPINIIVWIGFMLAIFYVVLIRPQHRKEKERKKMLENLKTGERVSFSGGIIGTISNAKETTFVVKIAENVKIEVARSAVTQVLEKGAAPTEE